MSVEYLDRTPDRQVDSVFIATIAKRITAALPGRTCIELGVGDRMWTPELLARFESVTSVDGSEALVQVAAAELDNPRWTGVASYFEDFTPAESVDVVLATYVLEHVDDPVLVLRRAATWIVPHGEIVVVVPNAGSLHRRLGQVMGLMSDPRELGEADLRLGHKRVFTPESLRETIEAAGLVVHDLTGYMAKALPNSLLTQCSDEQLRGLVDVGSQLPLEFAGALAVRARLP
jgi:2-polyprenyl-3-methyl-5-hydroxy-6-metoxy-1,4-benzoquinol methylase